MSQQIIISKGDRGTILEISLLESKAVPLSLVQDTVNVYVVLADNTEIKLHQNDVLILDRINGIIEITLPVTVTSDVGNHAVYLEFVGSDYTLNTIEATYYYVVEKHGGATNA